jgi:hypothetical protein
MTKEWRSMQGVEGSDSGGGGGAWKCVSEFVWSNEGNTGKWQLK